MSSILFIRLPVRGVTRVTMAITAIIDICRLMSNMAIGLAIIKMSAVSEMLCSWEDDLE